MKLEPVAFDCGEWAVPLRTSRTSVPPRRQTTVAASSSPSLDTPRKVQSHTERILQDILRRIGGDPASLERLRSLAATRFERLPDEDGPVVAALTQARVEGALAMMTRRAAEGSLDLTA